MKLLFIGNANSFLIISLAKQLKKFDPSIAIDILSSEPVLDSNSPFRNVYCKKVSSSFATMKYVKVLYFAWSYRKLLNTISNGYDAVHIFYISSIYRLVWKQIKSKSKRVVLTVFGSEFYRSSQVQKKMIAKLVRESDVITSSNDSTLKSFLTYYNAKLEKSCIVYFGLSILDEIDLLTEKEVESFKSAIGAQNTDNLIALGSNASVNQNLPEIISQICLNKNRFDNFFFTFQFHGVRNEMINGLMNQLDSHQIRYKIFDDRFSDRELAIYRKAIDVFVQLQTTDQFSGAMQEHLYAGSLVITGKWLPYEILDDAKTDYFRINTISELGNVLVQKLDHKPDVVKNKRIIESISKWSSTIQDWYQLYK